MAKLSPSLKALINAPFARAGPTAAPAGIAELYGDIAREARQCRLGTRPWLAISAAATFTLNSPDSLRILHAVACGADSSSSSSSIIPKSNDPSSPSLDPLQAAEFVREVGLKCLSFNGIPRTINGLNAFRASLPPDVAARLSRTASRAASPANVEATATRGRALWDSIYRPLEGKLVDKLALAHPDLPVVILGCHYGPLLADPEEASSSSAGGGGGGGGGGGRAGLARVGRALTSLVAVACLRAQTGVGPQVVSHVFGLRKAVEDGTYRADLDGGEDGEDAEAIRWLAGDEGSEWVLRTVDRIVEGLGGSSFARARL